MVSENKRDVAQNYAHIFLMSAGKFVQKRKFAFYRQNSTKILFSFWLFAMLMVLQAVFSSVAAVCCGKR